MRRVSALLLFKEGVMRKSGVYTCEHSQREVRGRLQWRGRAGYHLSNHLRNSFFNHFLDECKVGNGTEIIEIVGICTRFFL